MNKRKPHPQAGSKTEEEAMKVARATQRPGQTKEQTKLIAQGIQKGIEQYKKQQNAKARELDKRLKTVRRQLDQTDIDEPPVEILTRYRQSKMAWVLLLFSWAGFAFYFFLN